MFNYKLLLTLLLVVVISGCSSKGPDRMQTDRFDYTSAVSESWKEQILSNIVRLRYGDWPAFVTIEQIVTAYTIENTGSLKFTGKRFLADQLTNDQIEGGWIGKFSERPTVLYRPLSGKKFVTALLTPAQPASLLALIASGWPADHLSRIAMQSVNDFDNARAEIGFEHRTDVGFAQFTRVLKKLQDANALKVRLVKQGGHAASKTTTPGAQAPVMPALAELRFLPQKLDPDTRKELQDLKQMLGLDADKNSFPVVWDSVNEDPGILRIQGRSVLQVMTALSLGVAIPPEHQKSGIAIPLEPVPDEDHSGLQPLLQVHSGLAEPERTFTKVKYGNMWYWIDKTDHFSKRSMLYALTLITLLESGDSQGGQVVISAN